MLRAASRGHDPLLDLSYATGCGLEEGVIAVRVTPDPRYEGRMLLGAWVDDCATFDPAAIPSPELRPDPARPGLWWCFQPAVQGEAVPEYLLFAGTDLVVEYADGALACPPAGADTAAGYQPSGTSHPALVVLSRGVRAGSVGILVSEQLPYWAAGAMPGEVHPLPYEAADREFLEISDTWLAEDSATLELVVCIDLVPQEPPSHTCEYVSGSRDYEVRRHRLDAVVGAYDARTGELVDQRQIEGQPVSTECSQYVQVPEDGPDVVDSYGDPPDAATVEAVIADLVGASGT